MFLLNQLFIAPISIRRNSEILRRLELFISMFSIDGNWLGFRPPDRYQRHRGPCGPHPRAKIPVPMMSLRCVALLVAATLYSCG